MKKTGLDERQERVMERIGAGSFLVMFLACAAVITIELICGWDIKSVLGETAALAAGGIIYLIGSIKNGIWTKNGRKMTFGQNLLLSFVFSGVFSIAYAFIIAKRAAGNVHVARLIGVFFIGIAALCFLCLWSLGKLAQNRHEKEESRCRE